MTHPTGRALRLAHRGDWRGAPENTLPALLAALDVRGCDGLEFDVRGSSDGVPILQHDETLARVHGRPERPQDLTAAELRASGVSVLADVLAALPPAAYLDIEVKDGPAASFVDVVEGGRGHELRHAVVSSFAPAVLLHGVDTLLEAHEVRLKGGHVWQQQAKALGPAVRGVADIEGRDVERVHRRRMAHGRRPVRRPVPLP